MTNVEIKVVDLYTNEEVDISEGSDFVLKTREDKTIGLYMAYASPDQPTEYFEANFPFELQITLF